MVRKSYGHVFTIRNRPKDIARLKEEGLMIGIFKDKSGGKIPFITRRPLEFGVQYSYEVGDDGFARKIQIKNRR
ncbi:hypothetical protein KY335_01870 [Candidatus Woesearchaeota archaeon]|nr:hypothetical protein [Candidatus Woesearchaeota archaeon]